MRKIMELAIPIIIIIALILLEVLYIRLMLLGREMGELGGVPRRIFCRIIEGRRIRGFILLFFLIFLFTSIYFIRSKILIILDFQQSQPTNKLNHKS